jgi:uncharacterized paraquat-inducible protein A
MLAFITWSVSVVGKVLLVIFLINLFKLMKKGGKETVQQLADTAGMAIKLWVAKAQKWLWAKYKETEEEPKKPETTEASKKEKEDDQKACEECKNSETCKKMGLSANPKTCPFYTEKGA